MVDQVSVDLYVRTTFQDAQVARRQIEKVRSNLRGFALFNLRWRCAFTTLLGMQLHMDFNVTTLSSEMLA